MIYTTASRFARYKLDNVDASSIYLWLADWGSALTRPKGPLRNIKPNPSQTVWERWYNGKHPTVVQFTNSGTVPSSGRIDVDWALRTKSGLARLGFVGNNGKMPDLPPRVRRPQVPPDKSIWDEPWHDAQDAGDAGDIASMGMAGITGLGITLTIAVLIGMSLLAVGVMALR